jgi:mono/diheme cytochrome c family protein
VSQTLTEKIAISAALALLFAPVTALAGGTDTGKENYDLFCSSCHGFTGEGDGPAAIALQPPPRDFSEGAFKFDTDEDGEPGTDADLRNVITNGAGKYGGNMMMAPWGDTLSADEIDSVILYLRSLKD